MEKFKDKPNSQNDSNADDSGGNGSGSFLQLFRVAGGSEVLEAADD